MALVTPNPALDLVERSRRRLSSSSDVSAVSLSSEFSFISAAPSIQSLDTNGSVLGGIILELESVTLDCKKDVAASVPIPEAQHSEARAESDLSAKNVTPSAHLSATDESQSTVKCSPFWFEYPGFEPDPRAPFKHELGRLCKHVGAKTKKEKKDIQKRALTAEIKFHYGAEISKLDRWQELCKEVGIVKIPTSIAQCRKVCMTASCPADTLHECYEPLWTLLT
jgi:hypothetical protein